MINVRKNQSMQSTNSRTECVKKKRLSTRMHLNKNVHYKTSMSCCWWRHENRISRKSKNVNRTLDNDHRKKKRIPANTKRTQNDDKWNIIPKNEIKRPKKGNENEYLHGFISLLLLLLATFYSSIVEIPVLFPLTRTFYRFHSISWLPINRSGFWKFYLIISKT